MKHPDINTVLVTGGTGKIGFKLVEKLSQLGYLVLFTSRSKDKIKFVEGTLNAKTPGMIKGLLLDLESPTLKMDLDHLLDTSNHYPEAIINNARDLSYLSVDEQGETSPQNWMGEFQLGVLTPYLLVMHLLNHAQVRLKCVINIASMYGVVAPNLSLYDNPLKQSPINYGTVKAALIHLTKELAVRLAPQGIAVNAVSYGGVEGRTNEEFLNRYQKLCPQGRMLKEEEVAGPVVFLLSEAASAMTGHNLIFDGGWSIW